MSRPVIVMPDAVAVVTGYLRGALKSAGKPVLVVSRVPNPRPPTFVRVQRVGGMRQTTVSDRPRLDIHCWAESESAAHDLAALTRALLGALPGVRDGVTVYRVTEVGGPMWLPDSETSAPRFAFAVEVHMRGQLFDRP